MSMTDTAPQLDDWVVDIAKRGKPIGKTLWGSQEELAKVLLQNIGLSGSRPPKDTSIPRLIGQLNVVDGDDEHSFVILQEPQPRSKSLWLSSTPSHCELCRTSIDDVFFEAHAQKTSYALLCTACFEEEGLGLGLGRGRKFEKKAGDRYFKTAG